MADPVAASSSRASRVVRALLGVELLLLLGLAQVLFAGYRLGVGNQSIQIPFLKHWVDPGLFANDPMVKRTLADYPSFFYRVLAVLVARVDLYSAYFWLHVLTAAATLGTAYALGRAMFKDRAAGVVLVLLMLAGHHRALAGDDLYSLGFTHTWAVFPLAIGAMALFYAERYLLAFALVGLVFNLHALTAAYLFAMFAAWGAWQLRTPRGWWWRFGLCVLVFAAIASPTILDMLRHRQQFGAEWLERTRIRSADHSFPSTWWAAGASDLPRFVLLLGLAAVSMSFLTDARQRRKSLAIAVAAGAMFAVGWVSSDVWPVATVIRAQLFRSSRLIVVLVLAHVAWGIVCGWRLSGVSALWRPKAAPREAWQGSSDVPFPGEFVVSTPHAGGLAGRALEVGLATATFVCLAVPGLVAVAPWLLLAGASVAVVNARLSRTQAVVVGLALLVTVVAWRTIDYHVPGIDGVVSLEGARQAWVDAGRALWIATALSVVVWAALRVRVGWRAKLCAGVAAGFVCAAVTVPAYRKLARAGESDPWVMAQRWAAEKTPPDALFITPPQRGGFRIHSDRAVVCEWRDGTQLYFTAAFAHDWWEALTALRPSAYLDAMGGGGGGSSEMLKSKSLEGMSDREIVRIAQRFGATHVVLPAGQKRELLEKFTTGGGAGRGWTIYETRIVSAEEAFVENVVRPNIEKYRKSDARLELYDPQGRRVTDGAFDVRQTRQAFGFGISIPPFGELAGSAPEWTAPPVTPKQLDAVKGVFNFSVIPFSAKWNALEPEEGKRTYAELDKYVDWCVKNGIEMEFHYLSGFTPRWVGRLSSDKQKAAWIAYCLATVERYHDRIRYWQVTNDRRLGQWAADAFRTIRAKYPDVKLGTSDCQTFYDGAGGMMMGPMGGPRAGMDEIEQLTAEGVRPDFFATHGHKPNGVWPDMRTVYKYLDEFAALGVKIHVSEATVSLALQVIGRPELEGQPWTADMQARFLETFYTTLFSHPAVEVVNYWDLSASVSRGLRGGGAGLAGLLDPTNGDAPRPAYVKLKELIRERWMTRLSGRVANDGTVAFRGFHGEYEVGVKTADGRTLVGRFSVKPGEANRLRVQLSEEPAGKVASGE